MPQAILLLNIEFICEEFGKLQQDKDTVKVLLPV